MTRLRLAVLALIGAALLCAPLGALCSSCCVPANPEGMSVPMACCGDACGPSLTAARPRDPALAAPKTRLASPLSTAVQPQAIELPVATGSLPATLPAAPTKSPPVSSSVLRL